MIEQFAMPDVSDLSPGARVLAAGKDFRRRRGVPPALQRSPRATGTSWSCLIRRSRFIGRRSGRSTSLSGGDRRHQAGIKEAEAEDAGDGWRKPQSVKDGERLLEPPERADEAHQDIKRDNLLTFEQLGIDDMTIDRGSLCLNLSHSPHAANKGSWPGQQEGSSARTGLVQQIARPAEKPRETVTFANGTPISNSIVRMYLMMRFTWR